MEFGWGWLASKRKQFEVLFWNVGGRLGGSVLVGGRGVGGRRGGVLWYPGCSRVGLLYYLGIFGQNSRNSMMRRLDYLLSDLLNVRNTSWKAATGDVWDEALLCILLECIVGLALFRRGRKNRVGDGTVSLTAPRARCIRAGDRGGKRGGGGVV